MGREWLYKAGGGSDNGGGSRGGGKSPSTATTNRMSGKTRKEKNNSSWGCMSAIFNLFDVQHHQFRFHHPSFISESTIINSQQSNFGLQGVEAPRNSLESPESAMDVAPSSSLKANEQTNLNIPTSGIQIKTKRSRFIEDVSSECSSSPGTKTPNLVARLMGLDLLPEYSSPRPSSSSTPVNSHHRSRSLPTTPRMSTGSRQSTDNEYHHRLSLQIDKENRNSCSGHEHESLQMKMARRRAELLANRKDQDGTSEYAKQVANQVRERIGRRLGTDITNTVSSRNKELRRDSNLVLLKPKKPSAPPQTPASVLTQEPVTKVKQVDDSTSYSSSPKLRLLDIKSTLNKPSSTSHSLKQQEKVVKEKKIKKIASERYDLRLKKMNQHDDAMFGSKKKSTSLSNDIANVKNTTTKVFDLKKEMMSPSSTTRLPQKQVSLFSMTHLPSSLNSSYNSNDNRTLNLDQRDISQVVPNMTSSSCEFKSHQKRMFELSAVQKGISSIQVSNITTSSSTSTTTDRDYYACYFDYVTKIVDQCGIQSTTSIFDGRWYSPAHPLHPSIFHQLEKLYPTTTTIAATKRRMFFELTNEFLIEILKPYSNRKPWVTPKPPESCTMSGNELVLKLCGKIKSVPGTKCEESKDINRLIDRDIGLSIQRLRSTAFEAEVEEIVKVIEHEIMTTLVHEMVINDGNGGINWGFRQALTK